MSWRRRVEDRQSLLDRVLPEYEKITVAPLRVEDVPGYSDDFTADELSEFRSSAITTERRKRYKSIDADGNIYLVENPWTRHVELRDDGRHWVVHLKPQLIMSYAEARRKAPSNQSVNRATDKHKDEESTDDFEI